MPLQFNTVHIYEFERDLGFGGVPHTGGYPIGLGELEKEEVMDFSDFDTAARTKRRRRHPSRDVNSRLPQVIERARKVPQGHR